MGQGRRARGPGRARRRRWAAHGALHGGRPAPRAATAGLWGRRALAPAAPRPALRRRAHRVVPVLLAAGRRRGPAAPAVSPRRGLARGLVAPLLARVPRRARRPHRLAGAAPRGPRAPARLLLRS